jgi:hypothetical protein
MSTRIDPRSEPGSFSRGNAGLAVTKISQDAVTESVENRQVEKRLVVTGGRAFPIDINEFGRTR